MEEAVIQHLLADAAITSFVGNRVFPGSRQQGSELPAVELHRISGAPLYADDGEVGLQDPLLQIDCWAEKYATAKLLARAVTARLSAFDGTVNGTVFRFITLDDERDMRESGSNAAEYPFGVSLDFTVWNER